MTTAGTLGTLAVSRVMSAYLTIAIYSGAKAFDDDRELQKVAQGLNVKVEPTAYLPDLRNDVDVPEREREPGSEYFAHGTSTGAWKGSTISTSGGGDFGTGFYTFRANIPGLFAAGGRATKTANYWGGGLPFILVLKIKREDLMGMMPMAQDFRGDPSQWTTSVSGYLNNQGQGVSGHPIVIGPVSAEGRGLSPGQTPTQRIDLPDQWKWENVSKLTPAAVIPVYNGQNRKLAW